VGGLGARTVAPNRAAVTGNRCVFLQADFFLLFDAGDRPSMMDVSKPLVAVNVHVG
jgi:hypothetical protein